MNIAHSRASMWIADLHGRGLKISRFSGPIPELGRRLSSSGSSWCVGSVVGDVYDELADVRAVEEHVDRRGELLEALDDGFEHLEFARGDPPGEFGGNVAELVDVVEHDEAL